MVTMRLSRLGKVIGWGTVYSREPRETLILIWLSKACNFVIMAVLHLKLWWCNVRAAKCCIVEVEELVEPGEMDPNEIHLSGVYVHRIVKGELYPRRIWKHVNPEDDEEVAKHLDTFES